MEQQKSVAERTVADSLFSSLRHMGRAQYLPDILAGVTLLAIAIPEQLATAQLADVTPFLAILAFVAATIVFAAFGSNPIVSVGADSTISPLFAAVLIRVAIPNSSHYLVLVCATAMLAGLLIFLVGIFRLGWIADFLSAPIVAGFMSGVGFTIIVHQLPNALGLSKVTGTFIHRVATIATHLSGTNGWTLGLTLGTLVILVVGERLNAKVPFALISIVAATFIVALAHLASRGVHTLGTVSLVAPSWRLDSLSWSDMATVGAAAATVALVVLSQSAATSRDVADEMGVDVNINRDFVAIGLANVVTGALGTIPVNASPARTGVVRVAGGRTQLVGLVAAVGAFLIIPFAPALKNLPLAALAGVLFFIAGRLIKVPVLRQIARVDRYEMFLAVITTLAVIFIGVQEGIAVAVALAILDQTRRSARPRSVVLGRHPNSTSWEPIGHDGAATVDHVTVLLFTAPLYFANASLFRTEVHAAMRAYPLTRHMVIDAASMTDIDFTGLHALSEVVTDLTRDSVNVVLARAPDNVVSSLSRAPSPALRAMRNFGTVDEAVAAIEK